MATVERRGKRFRVIFYHGGRRYAASIKTECEKEADAIAGSVERTLMHLEQGVVTLPEGVDLVCFVLSGGRTSEKPKPPPVRTLTELHDRYIHALGLGAMEANSLDTVKLHLSHVVETLGKNFVLASLTQADLQRHVERRGRQKGHFKKRISTTTLKMEVGNFRACWNWGVQAELIPDRRFPNRGLKYPKTTEKPPFQTWEEIQRQIGRGGLTEAEQKELWDCLYLTMPEVNEFLAFARENARHDFLYPMLLTAAHTGARRSELLAARVEDVDLAGGTLLIREKKRLKGQRSFRRVPLTDELEKVLRAWLENHPGGQHLFCQAGVVARSKKRSHTTGHKNDKVRESSLKGRMATVRKRCEQAVAAVTRNEAHDHLKRLIACGKWQVLRGWHVFRHSFVSNCASTGTDQRMIDEWVGHTSEAMRRRYRHLIPSTQRQALRSVFGGGK